MINLKLRATCIALSTIIFSSQAQTMDNTVMVGGESMYSTNNIIKIQ